MVLMGLILLLFYYSYCSPGIEVEAGIRGKCVQSQKAHPQAFPPWASLLANPLSLLSTNPVLHIYLLATIATIANREAQLIRANWRWP